MEPTTFVVVTQYLTYWAWTHFHKIVIFILKDLACHVMNLIQISHFAYLLCLCFCIWFQRHQRWESNPIERLLKTRTASLNREPFERKCINVAAPHWCWSIAVSSQSLRCKSVSGTERIKWRLLSTKQVADEHWALIQTQPDKQASVSHCQRANEARRAPAAPNTKQLQRHLTERQNTQRALHKPLTFSREHKLMTFLAERKLQAARERESPLMT